MDKFIPIVIEPYEDEWLPSWLCRLARINEMTMRTFVEEYFGIKKGLDRPILICDGFYNFWNALQINRDIGELYLSLTTDSLLSLRSTNGWLIKHFNQIFYPKSEVNIIQKKYMHSAKMCLQCMEEDKAKYGEFYIHRAHQLPLTKICHKHKTPLVEYKTADNASGKNTYYFKEYEEIKIKNLENCIQQMEYVHKLFYSGVHADGNVVRSLMFDVIKSRYKDKEMSENEKEYNEHDFLIKCFIRDIDESLLGKVSIFGFKTCSPQIKPEDFITMLMYLYPDVDELIEKLKTEEKLLERYYCDKCDQYYYLTKYAYEKGWTCPSCMQRMSDEEIYGRFVENMENSDDYEFIGLRNDEEKEKEIYIRHKTCNAQGMCQPQALAFYQYKCDCEMDEVVKPEHSEWQKSIRKKFASEWRNKR